MSRTRKTNPWWVGAWWEPDHHLHCRDYWPRRRWQHVDSYRCCDLPDEPPNGHPILYSWRGLHTGTRCRWSTESPNYYTDTGRRVYGRSRHVGYTANRFERGVRAAWRDCAQTLRYTPFEYLDDMNLPDPRHRHFALWDEW